MITPGRWSLFVGVLAMAGLMVPAAPLRANDTSGVIVCDFTNMTVLTPGPFGGDLGGLLTESDPNEPGAGNFAGANVGGTSVNASAVCSGAINGTAIIEGQFTSCPQEDENGVRHGTMTPDDGTNAPTPAVEAGKVPGFLCTGLYGWESDDLAFNEDTNDQIDVFDVNVHTMAVGRLVGQGWRWDSGSPAPTACEFASSGHAPAPIELETLVTCPEGPNPTHLIRFLRPQGTVITLLFGPAQDLFHRVGANNSDTPDFQHCFVNDDGHLHVDADGNFTSGTWVDDHPDAPLSEQARCFRSSASNGQLWGTVETLN